MYFSATPCVSQADPISRLPSINQALGAHDGMDPCTLCCYQVPTWIFCLGDAFRHGYSARGVNLDMFFLIGGAFRHDYSVRGRIQGYSAGRAFRHGYSVRGVHLDLVILPWGAFILGCSLPGVALRHGYSDKGCIQTWLFC
jgi:hypothetical protein